MVLALPEVCADDVLKSLWREFQLLPDGPVHGLLPATACWSLKTLLMPFTVACAADKQLLLAKRYCSSGVHENTFRLHCSRGVK